VEESEVIAEKEPTPSINLVVGGVVVEFDGNRILHEVSFTAQPGQLIGVLGPSGSGKSTLLFAVSGFRPPKAGTVRMGPYKLPDDFEKVKELIGFVPQDDIVPTELKVERVLSYAADLRLPDLDPEHRRHRVNGVIRTLGLSERKTLRVAKLSGGQRKRVSVGVELLTRPKVLFADEPTSGLDPALERSMMETLKELADDDRVVLVTTHIMSSLELFDRLLVLSAGRVVYFGDSEGLKPYFEVDDFTKIYEQLQARSPEEWASKWRKHRGSAG
jgi:ABC-type multidrug transport system ATPase subunit